MNILLISYGDYEYDGRLRELHKIAKKIGNTFLISRGSRTVDDGHYLINEPYFRFITESVNVGKSLQKIDVLFLDNRKSIIPGLRLKKIFPDAKIVVDCRELYLAKYVKHFSGKLGCFYEKKGIKKADIVMCANDERAEFMESYYRLNNKPLVFDNYRFLSFADQESKLMAEKKFSLFVNDEEIRIISTAGCDLSRLTEIMVKSLSSVREKCRLFLVGGGKKKDVDFIKSYCLRHGITNVEILPRLSQNDLKALIDICHIGIVSYHQKDLNNKFCASGKIFEFLYEGIPVVTTTNPPLKKICDTFKVGVSDDLFYNGINEIVSDYSFFKENVRQFICSYSFKGVDAFSDELQKRLGEIGEN